MQRSLLSAITVLGLAAAGQAAAQQRPRSPGDFTLDELLAVSSLVGNAVPDWAPDYEGYPEVGGAESRLQWMPRVLAFFDRHLRADLEIRWPGADERE